MRILNQPAVLMSHRWLRNLYPLIRGRTGMTASSGLWAAVKVYFVCLSILVYSWSWKRRQRWLEFGETGVDAGVDFLRDVSSSGGSGYWSAELSSLSALIKWCR